jgi:hypothetical protein
VVVAFKNSNKQIAWPLRNRWKNSLWIIGQMNFIVSHIYREGNRAADLIANFGLNSSISTSRNSAPLFIVDSLDSNKLGLPNFRFCLT